MSCLYKRFVFSLASLVSPVQNIFSSLLYFPIAHQSGQAARLVHLCFGDDFNASEIFLKRDDRYDAWASNTFSTLSDAESWGMKKTMEKRETPHISCRVFLTRALSSVFFYIFDKNFISAEYKIVTAILEQ